MNKIQKENGIIININEANKAQKYQKKEELFQIEAFEKVSKILYEHSVGNNTNDITDCRFHDTIFIDGDRGVGKTAFMINIENFYKKYFTTETLENKKEQNYNDENRRNCFPKNENKGNFIFLKPVDPTLLEHTEKFLGVVFGKIVEMVSIRLKNNCVDENSYSFDDDCNIKSKFENQTKHCIDSYYRALENLSKSLGAVSSIENKQSDGIEEIASYKSSLKLEQYAHEFFQVVCKMFGVNAIVMLIDDVDMAFDKGFDVLEVVRKYLASPYLIPIVAGDMKLYREIVETKFMDKIDFYKDISAYNQMKSIFEKGCSDDKQVNKSWDISRLGCDYELLIQNRQELKDKKILLNHLVEQYLKKIFPNEYHIKLKDIFTILEENRVQVKLKNDFEVPYTEIKDFEIRHINLGINQVQFTYQIFSNNTRDLVQYLFAKKDIYIEFFTKIKDEYLKEAVYKKYIPQNVIEKYDNDIFQYIFKDNGIYKKSLEITSNIYEYAQDKQKELSKLTENDVRAFKYGSYNIYNAFNGDVFINSKIVSESINENLRVEYKSYKSTKTKYDDMEKYIVDLFVFSDYYTQHQTKKYFFVGKFIEMIIYSLSISEELSFEQSEKELINNKLKSIDFKSLLEEDDYNIYSIFYDRDNNDLEKPSENESKLSNIFNKIGLNSNDEILSEIPNKIPFNSDFLYNKRFVDSRFDDDDADLVLEYETNELKRNLVIWKNIFCSRNLKLNSIALYEILHKFFNNFNVVKHLELNDTPLDFMKRTVLIFINAVAYFENTNTKVANTNIAVAKQFDYDFILEKTNASLKNIKPMFDEEDSLTKALFFHPIISHILYPNDDSKLEFLKFVNAEKMRNITFNTFNNIYNSYFTQNGKFFELENNDKFVNYLTEIIELFEYAASSIQNEVMMKFSKNKYHNVFTIIENYAKERNNIKLNMLILKYFKLIYGE